MNKKVKKILIIVLIFIILFIGVYLEISYLSSKSKNKNLESINQITYLEKESIEKTIEKINTLFLDNGMNTQISKNEYIVKNNIYYYEIYENISFYIKPIEYSGNIISDIVYDLGIYYPNDSKYEGDAKIYLKLLIKSNNNELNDKEIEKLINEAVELSRENQDVNKNTGISIHYFDAKENNNYKEFVIRRHYKDE